MIATADTATLTVLQILAMVRVVIDQYNAISEVYAAYKALLRQPTPSNPLLIPAARDKWATRVAVFNAATHALADALHEAGTPINQPLKLMSGSDAVILRLYRLTDDGRLSVQIVADAWGFAG